MSAQVTITQLPAAGPITGAESVPIVQNGVTVQTTTGAISASPSQTQTFLTVNQEPTLPNSRYFGATNGLSITDGGAQGLFNITTTGALSSLVASGTGIQVKTSSTAITGRSIAVSGAGLSIADGSGVSGNPTVALDGQVLNFANLSANGLMTLSSTGAVSAVTIAGTANQIAVTNGNGISGAPTIALANNPVLGGTESLTLPIGATGSRPVAAVNGMIRYNSTTTRFEGYQNNSWVTLGLGDGTVTNVSGTASQISVASGSTTPVLSIANDPVIPGTGGVVVPAGTTAQRGTSTLGNFRYNSSTGSFEGYNGAWTAFAAGSGVTSVATGTGLTGGPITSTGTISLDNTAVTAGSYTSADITVDAQGRITAAASGSGGTGTVTSVDVSGGTTGLTTSGGPVTAAGTITLAGTLGVANGGTGRTVGNYSIYANEIHVGKDGNDTTGDGTLINPVLTITKALTLIAAGRNTVIVHPGSYSESPTVSSANTTISTTELTGANTQIAGTLTLSAAARVSGIKLTNLTITGSGNTYISNCTVDTQLIKSGSNYVEIINTELQCVSGVQITGAGTVSIVGNKCWSVAVSNASANVLIKDCYQVLTPSVSAGNLQIDGSAIFATSPASNAVTSSAGSFITLANSFILNSAGTGVERVSLAGSYSILNLVYDKTNSTFAGTNLNAIDYFSVINADSLVLTNDLPISQGGTGQSTAAAAITALTGTQTSGQYLRSNGTNAALAAIQAGDVPTLNQNTTGTAANVTGTVAVANGGTGQTSYINGELLIGNTTGNTLAKATLTAGSGISITNGAGSITIAASGGGGGCPATPTVRGTVFGKSDSSLGKTSLGHNAGLTSQGNFAIAIGNCAGKVNQGASAIAIGYGAAQCCTQGCGSIAIGVFTTAKASLGIAIGSSARTYVSCSIAIGTNSLVGITSGPPCCIPYGVYSIAIGYLASNYGCNSIAIGSNTTAFCPNRTHIGPIRSASACFTLKYNPCTREITYT